MISIKNKNQLLLLKMAGAERFELSIHAFRERCNTIMLYSKNYSSITKIVTSSCGLAGTVFVLYARFLYW